MSESTWQWLIGTLIGLAGGLGVLVKYLLSQISGVDKEANLRMDRIEQAHDTLLQQIHAQRMEDSRLFYENSRSLEDRLVSHLDRLRDDFNKKHDGIISLLMGRKDL